MIHSHTTCMQKKVVEHSQSNLLPKSKNVYKKKKLLICLIHICIKNFVQITCFEEKLIEHW
jgi:hypothetical protein